MSVTGLGYVGLPLALEFARHFRVIGFDINAERVALINDCHLLCVLSIGGPAAARVVNAGVHPFKRPQAEDISALLSELQQVLAGEPPPWLARIIGHTRVTPEWAGEAS